MPFWGIYIVVPLKYSRCVYGGIYRNDKDFLGLSWTDNANVTMQRGDEEELEIGESGEVLWQH